jgi:glycerol kinase
VLRAGHGEEHVRDGCFLLLQTGAEAKVSANRLLTTVAWRIGDVTEYALEGSVFIGGAVVQCSRRVGAYQNVGEIETLAATVPDNGGVLSSGVHRAGHAHWDRTAGDHRRHHARNHGGPSRRAPRWKRSRTRVTTF